MDNRKKNQKMLTSEQNKNKITIRPLTDLEKKILEFIKDRKKNPSAEDIAKFTSLAEQAKQETVHPAYTCILYVYKAMTLLTYSKKWDDSNAFINYATKLIANRKQDKDWDSVNNICIEMLNTYFQNRLKVILINLQAKEFDNYMRIISGGYTNEKQLLDDMDLGEALIQALYIKNMNSHLVDINQILFDIMKTNYLDQNELTQNYILYYALMLIFINVGQANINEKIAIFEHDSNSGILKKVEKLDQNKVPKMQEILGHFCNALSVGKINWSTAIIDQSETLYLLAVMNRFVLNYFSEAPSYPIFCQLIYSKIILPNFAKVTDAKSVMYLTQMNCDRLFKFSDFNHLQFTDDLFNSLCQPAKKTGDNPFRQVVILWQASCDILFSNILRQFEFKKNLYKGKNQDDQLQKYLDDLKGLLKSQRSYSVSNQQKILADNIRILKKISPVLEDLEKKNKDHFKQFYLTLPYYAKAIFEFKEYLPTIHNLRLAAENPYVNFNVIAHHQKLNTLKDLNFFYEILKRIFALFVKNSYWLARNEEMVKIILKDFQPFITKQLELITVEQQKIAENIRQYEAYENEQEKAREDDKKAISADAKKLKERKRHQQNNTQSSSIMPTSKYIASIDSDDKNDEEIKELDVTDIEAQAFLKSAFNEFSNENYFPAKKIYKELGDKFEKYKPHELEGKIACETKILIREIHDLIEQITRLSKKSYQYYAKQIIACDKYMDILRQEKIELIADYKKALQNIKEMMHIDSENKLFIMDWRENLNSVFTVATKSCKGIMTNLIESMYNDIMSAAFETENKYSLTQFNALDQIGYSHLILKENKSGHPLYKQFIEIYHRGINRLLPKSYNKKEEYLNNLKYLQLDMNFALSHNQPTQTNHKVATIVTSTPSVSSDAVASVTASEIVKEEPKKIEAVNPLTPKMSLKAVLTYVMDHEDFLPIQLQMIQTWIKQQAKSNFQEEILCQWLLTENIDKKIEKLDQTGLLRWILEIPGNGPLFVSSGSVFAKEHLTKIGKQIELQSKLHRASENTMVQVVVACLIAAYEPEVLVQHRCHYGSVDNPIVIASRALNLSKTAEDAVCCHLTTYEMRHQEKPVSNIETIQALINYIYPYNIQLLNEANLLAFPIRFIMYGSAVVLDIIQSKRMPRNLNLFCTIGLNKIPFKAEISPVNFNIYHRVTENGLEESIAINFLTLSTFEFMNSVDCTAHQVGYNLLTNSVEFYTPGTEQDIANKTIKPIHPITNLRNDSSRMLSLMTSCNNYDFCMHSETISQIKQLIQKDIAETKDTDAEFVNSIFEPQRLFVLFYERFLCDSAEKYFNLCMQLELLPYLLPIPLSERFLSKGIINELTQELREFDKINLELIRVNRDVSMVLGKLIIAILAKTEMIHLPTKDLVVHVGKYIPMDISQAKALEIYQKYYKQHHQLINDTKKLARLSIFPVPKEKPVLMLQEQIRPKVN